MTNGVKEYEAILIASSELNPEALANLQNQFGEMVARQGGKVLNSTSLGKRRLSFKIGKHQEGNYVQLKFEIPPSGIEGLKKTAALSEGLVRLMIVQASNVPPPVFRSGSDTLGPESDL